MSPARRSRRGRFAADQEKTRRAQIEYRQVIVDEIVQHPDVWEYIAEQAGEVAALFPVGSGEWATFLWLAKASTETAAVLERAQTVSQQAAS